MLIEQLVLWSMSVLIKVLVLWSGRRALLSIEELVLWWMRSGPAKIFPTSDDLEVVLGDGWRMQHFQSHFQNVERIRVNSHCE